jgi:hypothetical protein
MISNNTQIDFLNQVTETVRLPQIQNGYVNDGLSVYTTNGTYKRRASLYIDKIE